MNTFEILWKYRQAFFNGFLTTAELLFFCAVSSTLVAAALEWLCQKTNAHVRHVVDVVAFCSVAIPALVILFWFHYPAQTLLGIVIPPFWTALFTLSLMNTFAIYRVIADAMRDLPYQFIATGKVCGLTAMQITRYIKAPLILRAALPRWIDQQVVILQTSLFASLIGVNEAFRVAMRINSQIYRPVAIYTSMAIVFLATAGSAMYYARYLRLKYHRDFSER
ncbi:ABC transporter permease subunit [Candidatus Latescibacterota bacterium]